MSPPISVLMPVYNCAPYLDEAIRSIREQTFRDFEFIIVNDGSIDGSPQIIRKHADADDRIKVINQKNGGIVNALNNGIAASKGKYIARMDGDDVCFPDRLEDQYAALESRPEVVALGSRAVLTCSEGVPILNGKEPVHYATETEHDSILSQLKQGYGAAMIHPVVTFRKSTLIQAGSYIDKYMYAQDLALYLTLSDHGELANLPKPHLLYRQHFNNIGTEKRIEQRQFIKEIVEDYHRKRGLSCDFVLSEYFANTKSRQLHTWTTNALIQKKVKAARNHAYAAIKEKPISRTAWKNLLKSYNPWL